HERRLAYLRHGPEMIRFLIGEGLRFERTPRYPDYYPEKPGGRVGRQLEPALVDGRRLGPLLDTLRMPAGGGQIVTRIGEFDRLILAFRTLRGLLAGARAVARTARGKTTRWVPLTLGTSLLAQLLLTARRHSAELWLHSPLRGLVVEQGRVAGAVVEREEGEQEVRARRGVVLAAGGFARNDELRRRHQPVGRDWSTTIGADTGDAI